MREKTLSLLPSALFARTYSSQATADLINCHLDVNMGDATFLTDTGAGRTLLVDAGNRSHGRNVVAPFLGSLGIDQVNYFVSTHYDADPIGEKEDEKKVMQRAT